MTRIVDLASLIVPVTSPPAYRGGVASTLKAFLPGRTKIFSGVTEGNFELGEIPGEEFVNEVMATNTGAAIITWAFPT